LTDDVTDKKHTHLCCYVASDYCNVLQKLYMNPEISGYLMLYLVQS